jgi:hypothetical protein
MTTLQRVTPSTGEADATREAQDARWNAWTSKAAADDRVTQRHVRIAFATLLIVLACVTLAVVL